MREIFKDLETTSKLTDRFKHAGKLKEVDWRMTEEEFVRMGRRLGYVLKEEGLSKVNLTG